MEKGSYTGPVISISAPCVNKAVQYIEMYIPLLVKKLQAASGPRVPFIGLLYDDPYLGVYTEGPAAAAWADGSLSAMRRVNTALEAAYTSVGVATANVPAAFSTYDTSLVSTPGGGSEPVNVEAACELTWMCYGAPFGPDDHPNNAGYSFIAETMYAAISAAGWNLQPR